MTENSRNVYLIEFVDSACAPTEPGLYLVLTAGGTNPKICNAEFLDSSFRGFRDIAHKERVWPREVLAYALLPAKAEVFKNLYAPLAPVVDLDTRRAAHADA
ncbi:MAG TPA: hypothetical protein VNR18_02005 [Hyphomicrobiales bacterium]|nr:hypothetical protein [Hyphomicrobiales bacterium]